jgi:hypothetical protein
VVGIDLHRRRTVLVTMQPDGTQVGKAIRITNSPARLKAAVTSAGANPRVVLEATYGWYWAVDAQADAGCEVHLAHPLGVSMFPAYGTPAIRPKSRVMTVDKRPGLVF